MSNQTPSVATLRRALEITEQIEKLESELKQVLNGAISAPKTAAVTAAPRAESSASTVKGKKPRKMSPEARARIVAAQKARWAKFNAEKAKNGRK